nr:palmitoyl-acyl carrier protein thioesterase [Tanacetum cinerariifolium]
MEKERKKVSMLLASITSIVLAAEKQWMMLDWKTKRTAMLADLGSFGLGRLVEDGAVMISDGLLEVVMILLNVGMTIFWVDFFACPASFPWHTGKNVSRDPFPKSTEFSADDYVVLVAHPALFRKFLEPFLCLIWLSHNYTLDEDTYPTFLRDDGTVVYPTKVKVGEWERAEEEARLLDLTVGCVVSLLQVVRARAESELEASVEKLFDEGGNTKQGDSTAGGGHDAEIELVTAVEDAAGGNVTVERPKHPRKKRPAATDASGSSHPPKKLRGDYGNSSELVIGGKSPSVMKQLLASSILSVEAGVSAMPTLPFVTSSVSATLKREGDVLLDSATGGNLRTIGLAVRFVISSDSSYHSSTNASRTEVDSVIRYVVPPSVITEAVITTSVANVPHVLVPRFADKVTPRVQQSIFHTSSSADTIRPDDAGPSHLPGKELSMGYRDVDFENLHDVFVPYWNILKDALLDDLDTSREFIDHLAPLVRMWTEYSLSERKRLESECERRSNLFKSRDKEIENLRAQLLLKEAEATEAIYLRVQVSAVEAAAKVHEFQDTQMKIVDDKVAKLDADLLEMACHLEEKFYLNLSTTISGQRWLLTHGLTLVLVKCLNSFDYLTALGAVISRAIE